MYADFRPVTDAATTSERNDECRILVRHLPTVYGWIQADMVWLAVRGDLPADVELFPPVTLGTRLEIISVAVGVHSRRLTLSPSQEFVERRAERLSRSVRSYSTFGRTSGGIRRLTMLYCRSRSEPVDSASFATHLEYRAPNW